MSSLKSQVNASTAMNSPFPRTDYDIIRPPYPQALWSLIHEHHDRHHPHRNSALDLCCGTGVAAEALISSFDNVDLVDASPQNMLRAPTNVISTALRAYRSNSLREVTSTYFVRHAEEPVVRPASQDLVTIFQALHCCFPGPVLEQAARALNPGGTLAIVYFALPRIVENPEADRVWNQIRREMHTAVYDLPPGAERTEVLRGVEQSNSGLDFVWLDTRLWKAGARRIKINCGEKGKVALQGYEAESVKQPRSGVQLYREVEEEMEMGEWSERVAIAGWFREWIMESLRLSPALKATFAERTADLWSEFGRAVGGHIESSWPTKMTAEDIKKGSDMEGVRIVFPAAVVLASKR